MRQKLSDLIFTIEGIDKNKKTDFYNKISNIKFKDYAEKYLLANSGGTLEDLRYDTSLYSISDFLKNSEKYRIYHSLDDFFVNKNQLEKIKLYSPKNFVCLNKFPGNQFNNITIIHICTNLLVNIVSTIHLRNVHIVAPIFFNMSILSF